MKCELACISLYLIDANSLNLAKGVRITFALVKMRLKDKIHDD